MTMMELAFSSPFVLPVIGGAVTLLLLTMLWWRRRQRQRRFLYASDSLEAMMTAESSSRPSDGLSSSSSDLQRSMSLTGQDEPSDPKAGPSAEVAGQQIARRLGKRHSGVWRPPSRESLMRRQQEEDQRRASRDKPTQRLIKARRHPITHWSPKSAHQDVLAGEQPPRPEPGTLLPQASVLSDAERSNRLGRKRQGLDSLITEWPKNTKESNGES